MRRAERRGEEQRGEEWRGEERSRVEHSGEERGGVGESSWCCVCWCSWCSDWQVVVWRLAVFFFLRVLVTVKKGMRTSFCLCFVGDNIIQFVRNL